MRWIWEVAEYEYRVADTRYVSGRIGYGNPGLYSPHTETLSDRYRKGDKVSVYYDPEKPNRAVLEPGVHSFVLARIFLLAMILLAFAIIVPLGDLWA